METKHKPTPMQIGNSSLIHFPNEAQANIPTSAKSLQAKFGLLPYQAKLYAELQNYDMGGAV